MALDTDNANEVKEFVRDLSAAITKDMAQLRETELDMAGGYSNMFLAFENKEYNGFVDVFVDKMGRLVTPAGQPWETLVEVMVGHTTRRVLSKEIRYEGDTPKALVIYLESEGGA